MKRLLALSAALALALAACATTPAPDQAKATATANAKPPAGCVAQTATHLPVKDDACAGFGSTYTKQDLDRTGQTNLDQALRTLDPSITPH